MDVQYIIILLMQILMSLVFLIYLLGTFKIAENKAGFFSVSPIMNWVAALPVLLPLIADLRLFAENSKARIALPQGNPTENWIIQNLTFLVFASVAALLIAAISRALYTISMLDQGDWWEVNNFRVYLRPPAQKIEVLLRLFIALAIIWNSSTILEFFFNVKAPIVGSIENTNAAYLIFSNSSPIAPYEGYLDGGINKLQFLSSGTILSLCFLAWALNFKFGLILGIEPETIISEDRKKISSQITRQLHAGIGLFVTFAFLAALDVFARNPILFLVCALLLLAIVVYVFYMVFIRHCVQIWRTELFSQLGGRTRS
jgi:hypothetical protein